MRDALGHVQSILVLGGTSEIAVATTLALGPGRAQRVVLTVTRARHGPKTPSSGSTTPESPTCGSWRSTHATRDRTPRSSRTSFAESGDFDLVLMAFGVLGDQHEFDHDPEAAADAAIVNYVGAVSSGLAVAEQFRRQGHGTLVVLSSVAAETRPQEQLRLRIVQGRPRRLRPGPGRRVGGQRRPRDDRASRLRAHPHDRPPAGPTVLDHTRSGRRGHRPWARTGRRDRVGARHPALRVRRDAPPTPRAVAHRLARDA